MISFIDTHAHLAMLEHSPLDLILSRAKLAGIEKMITVSTDEGSWESNENIAAAHPHIYFTLGIHPHDAIRWAECAHKLAPIYHRNAQTRKCVAIGEIGLDFHYNLSPREIQLDVLESQLQLAKDLNLPVVIHCRDAFEELYHSIRKIGLTPWGGVMHCFTGSTQNAKDAMDLGLKISFSGILTFKNAEALRETAKTIPIENLVLETDCPFLAPVPFRGKPNEPSYLPQTAHTLAAVRGETIESIAEQTTQNALSLFQL